MDRDGLGLPESPKATNGLVDLLKTIIQADKDTLIAMLPI